MIRYCWACPSGPCGCRTTACSQPRCRWPCSAGRWDFAAHHARPLAGPLKVLSRSPPPMRLTPARPRSTTNGSCRHPRRHRTGAASRERRGADPRGRPSQGHRRGDRAGTPTTCCTSPATARPGQLELEDEDGQRRAPTTAEDLIEPIRRTGRSPPALGVPERQLRRRAGGARRRASRSRCFAPACPAWSPCRRR